jgi:MinD-like ATPase involved in chromosome partitioning or flagellar assembly
MPTDEIIIEIQRIGAILRVAAVDIATGTEVIFQAPASASRASIDRLAANKLRYVMRKGATPPEDPARGGALAK